MLKSTRMTLRARKHRVYLNVWTTEILWSSPWWKSTCSLYLSYPPPFRFWYWSVWTWVRIPYDGSEFAKPGKRLQVSVNLAEHSEGEFPALMTLTKNKCNSTPILINYKKSEHENDSPLPGGYILFVVIRKLPGIRLSRDCYWNLRRNERNEICQAFKEAWRYVYSHIPMYHILQGLTMLCEATVQVLGSSTSRSFQGISFGTAVNRKCTPSILCQLLTSVIQQT